MTCAAISVAASMAIAPNTPRAIASGLTVRLTWPSTTEVT
jgi:hypothetical protein